MKKEERGEADIEAGVEIENKKKNRKKKLNIFFCTSHPSGNQVDGLPLVVHTELVLS